MPVRKVGDKYFWGSKGPFNSRKKARQVAKAAYASGYRKKEMNEMPNPRMEDVHIDSAMGRMKKINKMLDEKISTMKKKGRMEMASTPDHGGMKKKNRMEMGHTPDHGGMKKKDDMMKMTSMTRRDGMKMIRQIIKQFPDLADEMRGQNKSESKKMMGMPRRKRYSY
tara:strand:- start:9087 stop:9587 length:501 start_codon:yes stop_codon:yes gene_type:complete